MEQGHARFFNRNSNDHATEFVRSFFSVELVDNMVIEIHVGIIIINVHANKA